MQFYILFQQSFTSNWPKTMWFAVDQRGVHLLEFRTRNVLTSYEYDSILDYTPSLNHMLLITGSDKKQSKIIVTTNQVNSFRCSKYFFIVSCIIHGNPISNCFLQVPITFLTIGIPNIKSYPRIHRSSQ